MKSSYSRTILLFVLYDLCLLFIGFSAFSVIIFLVCFYIYIDQIRLARH